VHVIFIHDGAGKIDSAAMILEQFLSGQGIGQCLGIESIAFIGYCDFQPVLANRDRYPNFLLSAVPIAVNHCIDRGLVYCQADLI